MFRPFVHAPFCLNLFLSNLHTISATSVFVWFCCMCWLVFIFCGVNDVWAFGLIVSIFHSFLDWVLHGQKPSFSCWTYAFLFYICGLLATDLAISLHNACHNFTFLFISCYPVSLQADAPAMLAHRFINLLLRASLTHFPHLYLFWAWLANISTVPAYFTTSFLRLPLPIYFFSTSFTPISFLLDSLGFLEPIITSLPLVTIRAYWPLSQPIEFTNSFPRLLWPIYFLFISYYSHGLTTSFIELPQPIYFFFVWAC